MEINRKFKDSVFTKLFGEPDLLRELYCALEGVTLPPDIPVSINTLENVLIMDKYNDISFEIAGKLVVLIEHQSTINPNMALRLLLYIAEVYERMIKNKSIYSKKRLSIPWPEFFVLYNGPDPFPDEETLKLSDLFENPKELGLPEKAYPLLELEVKVININEGRNETIIQRCKKLAEYSTFIAKVRDFIREHGNKKEAIKEAVKFCKKCDILKEFLEIHAAEVFGMLYVEWNIDDAKKVWYEEAREEGWEEGREEGRSEGRTEGRMEEKYTIARNLLAKGSTLEFIHETTGLPMEAIEKL